MKRKIKHLMFQKPYDLLTGQVEYDEIRFEKQKNSKLKKAYYAYIATVSTTAILCVCLLLCVILGGNMSFLGGAVSGISGAIVKIDFMSLPIFKMLENIPAGSLSDITEGLLFPDQSELNKPQGRPEGSDKEDDTDVSIDSIYDFDYSAVPSGHTPIIPRDLSLTSYGLTYIHNSTGLMPNTEQLLNMKFEDRIPLEYLSASSSPTVLIIHTHGTEGYSAKGAISYLDDGGDIARSTDTEKNVVAVGEALKEALRKKGINSIHCEVMHDEEGYRDAYARSVETVRSYLERYPTIKLVIDLHRDAVISSGGELVRPVTVVEGKAAAQVMCVVGSNWGGEKNENWEANLSLALKLRRELNDGGTNLCRPVYLKSSTYNQELAPYSLLLEIGASGNSLDEAMATAELVADALGKLVKEI